MRFISSLGALSIVAAILAMAAGILILITKPGASNNDGWIPAAVFLIVFGLTGLINIRFPGISSIITALTIAVGVVLLIGWPGFRHHMGFILFCVWLTLVDLTGLVSLGNFGIITAILAFVSGILLILNE